MKIVWIVKLLNNNIIVKREINLNKLMVNYRKIMLETLLQFKFIEFV